MTRHFFQAAGAVLLGAALLLMMSSLLRGTRANAAQLELQRTLQTLLPQSGSFTQEAPAHRELVTAAYRSRSGCVVEVTAAGYAGDIVLLVGVDNNGRVTGLTVRDMQETYGLGFRALRDTDFLAQFLGTTGDAAIGDNADAISGATVTSKAIARAVNAASAYVTGADVYTEPTERGY